MRSRSPGPGAVTRDGCPVPVYAALPPRPEALWIRGSVAAGASVLDLGAGTGRLAEPLALAGLRVVAVDDSAEMLAHLHHAEPVCSRIEDLHLDERFDAVILASHLVNTPHVEQRNRLLDAAARHVAPDGRVLVEWHPPEWFDGLIPGSAHRGAIGVFDVTLQVHDLRDGVLSATVVYQRGTASWTQDFEAMRLTERDLEAALRRSHLRMVGVAPEDEHWVVARPEHGRGSSRWRQS